MKPRIALTGAGTATSTGFAVCARQAFGQNVDIVGFDMHPENAATPVMDRIIKCPRSDAPEYPKFLADICDAMQIDMLIPILDVDFMVLEPWRDKIPSLFMAQAAPKITDKLWTESFLRDIGLSGAGLRTEHIDTTPKQKAILKPRYGAGSVGVHIATSQEEIDYWTAREKNLIAFNFIEGTEYTVDWYRNLGAIRKREFTRGGVCTIASVYSMDYIEGVHTQIVLMLQELEWGLYPVCFQFIRDTTGNIRWIDLNPRVGGGTSMTAAAGLNIPAAILSDRFPQLTYTRTPFSPSRPIRVVRRFLDTML